MAAHGRGRRREEEKIIVGRPMGATQLPENGNRRYHRNLSIKSTGRPHEEGGFLRDDFKKISDVGFGIRRRRAPWRKRIVPGEHGRDAE